jgi:stage II sporulation protein D
VRTWDPRQPVRVRLSAYEHLVAIEIGDTQGGAVKIERAGELLRGPGGALAREFTIDPKVAARGVTIGPRRYPGRIVIRPAHEGGLSVFDLLDLEEYVAGVVRAEVVLLTALPAELEAQAIAARSFTAAQLAQREVEGPEPFLRDDTRDQSFRGLPELQPSPTLRKAEGRLAQAIEATRGLVLFEGERVVDARYHASCGGETTDAREIAPEAGEFACLRPVECKPCLEWMLRPSPRNPVLWTSTLGVEELDRTGRELEIGGRLRALEPASRDPRGRWREVEVSGPDVSKRMSFERVRAALGPGSVKSAWILSTIPRPGDPIDRGLRVEGRGRGHGLGLCQVGSHGYAERGYSRQAILLHYYRGARIAPLP